MDQVEVLIKAHASRTSFLEVIHGSNLADDSTLSSFEKSELFIIAHLLPLKLLLLRFILGKDVVQSTRAKDTQQWIRLKC
jgi:hypothetical protein